MLPAGYRPGRRASCASCLLFCFSRSLRFAGDVAATVALGQNVFANRCHKFSRAIHAAADGRLNGHLEHLARNQFTQARHQIAATIVGLLAMANHGQRVHRLAANQHIELHQIRFPGCNPPGDNRAKRSRGKRF